LDTNSQKVDTTPTKKEETIRVTVDTIQRQGREKEESQSGVGNRKYTVFWINQREKESEYST
jgi:hypothetical protein